MESSEVSKECIKRKKRAVHVDRHTGRLRGRAPESRPRGSLNHSFRTFLWVSFGQSFWFAWFTVTFIISQNPPNCSHTSLRQDGFYQRGLWVEHLLTSLTFDPQGAFLCVCGREGLLASRMKNVWSRQGPAYSLNCSVFVLEFWFTGNESPIDLPWELGVGFYFWPQLFSLFFNKGVDFWKILLCNSHTFTYFKQGQ